MRLLFLYGPVASGKLTIARIVAARTGMALFHNHLVVDAVAAVFPFGSADFVRLRERFWIETVESAARTGRSLIFTFAPEPSVAADFPERLAALVAASGGETIFVALDVDASEQERRLVAPGRAEFAKLRSLDILRQLKADFDRCMAAMPAAALRVDTGRTAPGEAADAVVALLSSG